MRRLFRQVAPRLEDHELAEDDFEIATGARDDEISAKPELDKDPANRTLVSTKILVGLLGRVDAIQLAQQLASFFSPGLDQFLQGEALIPQRFANLVERLHCHDRLRRDQHPLWRPLDRDQIAFLQAEPPPDIGRQGDLTFLLNANELTFCCHVVCSKSHTFQQSYSH